MPEESHSDTITCTDTPYTMALYFLLIIPTSRRANYQKTTKFEYNVYSSGKAQNVREKETDEEERK